MTRRSFGVVVAALAVGGGAARAADEPAEDRALARQHFDQGEAHFKQGRFAEALVSYEAGYQAAPLPGFLIDIAQCHRMMGDLRKARAHYRKFLLVSPQSPRRKEVESLIQDLDRAIAAEPAPPATSTPTAPAVPTAEPTQPARPTATRWWLWTALASSVVGNTVASFSAPATR